MILGIILITIGVILFYFVLTFFLVGLSFKDFCKKWRDNTYWQQKYNTAENTIEINRRVHAENTIKWTEMLEEKEATIIYKTTKIQILNNENKKLKERIKELEK